MDFVRLTEEEKEIVLNDLDLEEKDSLPFAESILQKIAGIYINKAGYHPEMANLYNLVAGVLSDLRQYSNNHMSL